VRRKKIEIDDCRYRKNKTLLRFVGIPVIFTRDSIIIQKGKIQTKSSNKLISVKKKPPLSKLLMKYEH
jgi:hypothetical protein